MPKSDNTQQESGSTNSLFADRKKSVESLLARANTINDEFKFIYGNSRADITTELNDIITDISALLPGFDQFATAHSRNKIESIFQAGELMGTCDDGFARIAEIVCAFNVSSAPAGASYTYLMTTQQDIDTYNQQYEKYESDQLNARIYDDLVAQLSESSICEIEKMYIAHKHCDLLFARYIASALKNLAPTQRIPYLEALERAKTRAIVGADEQKRTATLWPLQRFGLIPIHQGMTIAQLANYFFSGSKMTNDTIDGFIELARAKKMNIAVIRAIVRNPIEHNIRALIEKTESKIYDASAGVNDAILERFNMTRKRAVSSALSNGYSMQEYAHAPGDRRWILVRTIDDAQWDIMSIGSNARVESGAFSDVSIIERMRRGPSPRIDAYATIKNDMFAQHIYAPPPMAQDETAKTDSVKKANKALINSLVARITGRILQYIDKALVPLPTNPKGIEDAISDPRFVEIMQEEFLASYSEIGLESASDTKNGSSEAVPTDEMVGTFIADLEGSIAIQFARAIKLNMIELGPGAKIFKEVSGAALQTRIYNLFVDVIKRSVSSAILTKENVFEKILIKDHILGALARQLKH